VTEQPTLTPEETEDFLREVELMAWDYALEDGNDFAEKPPAEEQAQSDEGEDDRGWRQSDFV
jgi:hypothetical protein